MQQPCCVWKALFPCHPPAWRLHLSLPSSVMIPGEEECGINAPFRAEHPTVPNPPQFNYFWSVSLSPFAEESKRL